MDAARDIDPSADDKTRFVVCSHSCDLGKLQGNTLLIVRGEANCPHNGQLVGGASITRLQLISKSASIVHYSIETLQFVDASLLDRFDPWRDESHLPQECDALRLWLSQRFDRLELPDAVVEAFDGAGLRDVLIRATKTRTKSIVDIRTKLDEAGRIPSIAFLIVYDAGTPDGSDQASQIAVALNSRAKLKESYLDGKLIFEGAYPIADTAILFSQYRMTKPYRTEYLSLRSNPPAERPTK